MTIAPERLDLEELDWPTPELTPEEPELTPEQQRYRKFGWHPSVPDPDAPKPEDYVVVEGTMAVVEPVEPEGDYSIYTNDVIFAVAPSTREEMQPMYQHGGLIMGGGGGRSVFDHYPERYADYQGREHYCYCSPTREAMMLETWGEPVTYRLWVPSDGRQA